jgi:SAM-dependent methyltransferase
MPFTEQIARKVGMAVGTDIGEIKAIKAGPYGVRADLGSLPFKENVFDIVISMSVIEHLQNPRAVLSELSRVLKPNAIAILQTPNKYDYVSLIARFTPTWFHRRVLACLLSRKEEDTFPTFFSANSQGKIVKLLNHSNFVPLKVIRFNQYPAYLMFSPLLFRLGICYERITSHFEFCAQLRAWILVVAQKRGARDQNLSRISSGS